MSINARAWGLLLSSVGMGMLWGQGRVDPQNTMTRIICVVPIAGAGTYDDPRRPMFAPTASQAARQARGQEGDAAEAILSFQWEPSDDGKMAIVEFAARDSRAFAAVRNSGRADVKVFERGRATKAEVETEFRKYKRDFNALRFSGYFGAPGAQLAEGSAQ